MHARDEDVARIFKLALIHDDSHSSSTFSRHAGGSFAIGASLKGAMSRSSTFAVGDNGGSSGDSSHNAEALAAAVGAQRRTGKKKKYGGHDYERVVAKKGTQCSYCHKPISAGVLNKHYMFKCRACGDCVHEKELETVTYHPPCSGGLQNLTMIIRAPSGTAQRQWVTSFSYHLRHRADKVMEVTRRGSGVEALASRNGSDVSFDRRSIRSTASSKSQNVKEQHSSL